MDCKSDQHEQVHINALNQEELFPVVKQSSFSEYLVNLLKYASNGKGSSGKETILRN